MNKDELRIRIIPEDGEILIETYTDGIVKCKRIFNIAASCRKRHKTENKNGDRV